MLCYFKVFVVTIKGFFPTGRVNENHELHQTYLEKCKTILCPGIIELMSHDHFLYSLGYTTPVA